MRMHFNGNMFHDLAAGAWFQFLIVYDTSMQNMLKNNHFTASQQKQSVF